MPCAFVCRDHVVDPLLDELAAALGERGVRIVRGPPTQPGARLVYPREQLELLAQFCVRSGAIAI